MTRMVYLAYPIDANHRNVGLDLVSYAVDQIAANQAAGLIFDPGAAFTVGAMDRIGSRIGVIASIDGVALAQSDTVLAFLPAGVATIGVPTEIERAVAMGKQVYVFTDIEPAFMLTRQEPNLEVLGFTAEAVDKVVAHLELGNGMPEGLSDIDSLPFKLLEAEARLPTRAYGDDAGFDLYTCGNWDIGPGEWMDVPTGVAVELPSYVWAMLTGRSSTWRNLQLNVINGVIDPGYRGPLFAAVHNPTDETIHIKHDIRLAQLIIMPNATQAFRPIQVERLNPSPRGSNGFGSSGA